MNHLPAILQSAAREKLSLSTLHALSLLSERPVRLSDLARALDVSTAAATGIADRLGALQLAQREFSVDRRSRILTITPKGREIYRRITTP